MTGDGRTGAVAGLLTCLLWAPPALVAVGGFLTLNGPLNSGNGLVGGMAAPVGVWLVWIGSVSLWWLRDTSTRVGPDRVRGPAAPLGGGRPA